PTCGGITTGAEATAVVGPDETTRGPDGSSESSPLPNARRFSAGLCSSIAAIHLSPENISCHDIFPCLLTCPNRGCIAGRPQVFWPATHDARPTTLLTLSNSSRPACCDHASASILAH